MPRKRAENLIFLALNVFKIEDFPVLSESMIPLAVAVVRVSVLMGEAIIPLLLLFLDGKILASGGIVP